MIGRFINKIKLDIPFIVTFLKNMWECLKNIWNRIVSFIREFLKFLKDKWECLKTCIGKFPKFLRDKWECLKTCIGKFPKFLRDKWKCLKTCIGKFETILFFAFLGLGIGWLSCQDENYLLWQKMFSLVASGLFIFLMRNYRKNKLDPPKLKDDRDAERYTEKKTFFDYFSHRSYISRHQLKVDEKYFALWKNHYPYNQYKSQEKFANAQEVKWNNIADNNYQKKLKEKVENKIFKSSKKFIFICMGFAFAYAISCSYGFFCLYDDEYNNDKTHTHKDNIIGTTQDVIFTYQSSLLEEGQKMEITVPAAMLKYNYKGKHYHAYNLQAVYNSINTIINPDFLQFYIDKDSLKSLNKTNEYPELNDLEKKLKDKIDSIEIKATVRKDTVIPFKDLSSLLKDATTDATIKYGISRFIYLGEDSAKSEIAAYWVKCTPDSVSADGLTLSHGTDYSFYLDAEKIVKQLNREGRKKIEETDSLVLSKRTEVSLASHILIINSKEKYYKQQETTIFKITKTQQNTFDLFL